MSKMRVIMLACAVGSAVVAGMLAKSIVAKKPGTEQQVTAEAPPPVKEVEVLVAANDIEIGAKLAPGSIVWKPWPADAVQDMMITKEEKPDAEQSFAEARARMPIYSGETILERKLVFPGSNGFMSAVLPKGMRAISVAISSRSSAGGFILPNDRVDVILTRKISNPNSGSAQLVKSETVISNVRVLAINQIYKPQQGDEEVALKEGETATLELTLPQAEVLARTESEGELSLALRSIAESDGKAMEEGPQLADKFKSDGKTQSGAGDTLFVRYGIETYATSR